MVALFRAELKVKRLQVVVHFWLYVIVVHCFQPIHWEWNGVRPGNSGAILDFCSHRSSRGGAGAQVGLGWAKIKLEIFLMKKYVPSPHCLSHPSR